MIHTFGDSHTTALNVDEKVIQNQIPACLCYSFGRDKFNKLNITAGTILNDTI
jgi:hypothetical protein